jgi:ATP-dependent Clp protease ATP-binding subunit ClpC
MFLPKMIIDFILWWAYLAPRSLFNVCKRLAHIVDNQLSFSMNVRLFFTPLYGDYTIIGRAIGLILRTFFIIFGLLFVGILSLITVILPIAWYLIPLLMFYYLGFWTLPVILATFLYVTYLNLNIPKKRVSKTDENNISDCIRPSLMPIIKNLKKNSSYQLLKFFKTQEIQHILRKTELANKEFEERISKVKNRDNDNVVNYAYQYAKENKARYIEPEHLFLAILKSTKNIDNILAAYGVDLSSLEETASWIVDQREELSRAFFWQEDYEMPQITGFGHGLTGRVTPYLDSVSIDYTKMVKNRRLRNIIGREEEIEKIANLLSGSKENVLLIGEPGCGKTSIVMGIAHKIMHGTKHKTLQNKRLVSLQMGNLIAGTKGQGAVAERLTNALEDAIGSRDIILFIDEIHSLVGSVGEGEGFSTVFSVLEPYLSSGEIQFIGATSIENYRKYMEPVGSFSRLFEIVEIPEASDEDTLEILKYIAGLQENEHGVEITMPALISVIELSRKLIHDKVNPDKSIDILIRAVSAAKNNQKIVNAKLIEKEISETTHIPVTAVSEEESAKLMNILPEMKNHVIGQDHALEKIAAALKRARLGIRDENKPIASFLFVGTTGVGKTETAKTLSKTYFGNEDAMIRLDMSEYQNMDSLDRLIGTSDGKTKGILTEAIRSKPFSVVLLDEIEKAHHKILLTFLQVLDDGRLTDSTGRTVSFNNTIIIATSNVGTKTIQEITARDGSYEEIEDAALRSVREQFAPEFLNRFTDIIVYKPLTFEDLTKIADILLEKVRKIAEEKKIEVTFSKPLIEELVRRGYNPQWGARPMARVIEEHIETYLAEKILLKEIKKGDAIRLGVEVFE